MKPKIISKLEVLLAICVFVLLAFYFIPNIIILPVFLSVLYIIHFVISAIRKKQKRKNWRAIFLSMTYLAYFLVKTIGNVPTGFLGAFLIYSFIFILSIDA